MGFDPFIQTARQYCFNAAMKQYEISKEDLGVTITETARQLVLGRGLPTAGRGDAEFRWMLLCQLQDQRFLAATAGHVVSFASAVDRIHYGVSVHVDLQDAIDACVTFDILTALNLYTRAVFRLHHAPTLYADEVLAAAAIHDAYDHPPPSIERHNAWRIYLGKVHNGRRLFIRDVDAIDPKTGSPIHHAKWFIDNGPTAPGTISLNSGIVE